MTAGRRDSERSGRHTPVRTCLGCRQREAKRRLVRIAIIDGRPGTDARQRAGGRGAYVHRRAGCVDRATRRGGLARGLRTSVTPADGARLRRDLGAELTAGRDSERAAGDLDRLVKGQ